MDTLTHIVSLNDERCVVMAWNWWISRNTATSIHLREDKSIVWLSWREQQWTSATAWAAYRWGTVTRNCNYYAMSICCYVDLCSCSSIYSNLDFRWDIQDLLLDWLYSYRIQESSKDLVDQNVTLLCFALLGFSCLCTGKTHRPRGTSHGEDDAAGWKSVVANNCPWRSLRLQSAPRPHQECQSVVAFQFLVALGDAMPRANKQTASALVVAAKVSAESCRPTSSSTSEEEKGEGCGEVACWVETWWESNR